MRTADPSLSTATEQLPQLFCAFRSFLVLSNLAVLIEIPEVLSSVRGFAVGGTVKVLLCYQVPGVLLVVPCRSMPVLTL